MTDITKTGSHWYMYSIQYTPEFHYILIVTLIYPGICGIDFYYYFLVAQRMYGKAMELSTWAQKQLAKASQQALHCNGATHRATRGCLDWGNHVTWNKELDVLGYVWDEHEDSCGVLSWFVMKFTYYLSYSGAGSWFSEIPGDYLRAEAKHLAPSWWVQPKSELHSNVRVQWKPESFGQRVNLFWHQSLPQPSRITNRWLGRTRSTRKAREHKWTMAANGSVINVQGFAEILS